MKSKADWLAWTLQLILGFIGGFILSFFLSLSKRRGSWLSEDCIMPFAFGVALLASAFTSHFGDRIWLGDDSYRMIPPEEPRQSSFSTTFSIVIGIAGVGLIGFAVLRTFGVL